MKEKKGFLISLMIIFGIVILAVFLFMLAARSQWLSAVIKPQVSESGGVQLYAEDCLDSVAKYAAYTVGKQGGSIHLQPSPFTNLFLEVNYAFDSANEFPGIDTVKSEMEQFINENLKNCTAGFRSFEAKGMKIEEGNVSSHIFLGPKSFVVKAEYPLKITSGGKTASIDVIQKDIPLNLGRIHSETNAFLSGFSDRYNLTYLRGRSSSTYILPFGETDLFVEASSESRLFGENYLFLYAVR